MSYKLSMVALSKSILKWVKDQMKEGSEGRAVANVKMSRDTSPTTVTGSTVYITCT